MAVALVEQGVLTEAEYQRLTDILSPHTVESAIVAIEKKDLSLLAKTATRSPRVSFPVEAPNATGQGLVEKPIDSNDALLLIALAETVLKKGIDLRSNGGNVGGR